MEIIHNRELNKNDSSLYWFDRKFSIRMEILGTLIGPILILMLNSSRLSPVSRSVPAQVAESSHDQPSKDQNPRVSTNSDIELSRVLSDTSIRMRAPKPLGPSHVTRDDLHVRTVFSL